MKFLMGIIVDTEAENKVGIIHELSTQINAFLNNYNCNDVIKELAIKLYLVNPPIGYEHLYKDFKPKFTEYKLITSSYTGEKIAIEKQFNYSIKISGAEFKEFVNGDDNVSRKIIAIKIYDSLSNFEALPKKVKGFDKAKFLLNMGLFFEPLLTEKPKAETLSKNTTH